jgi:deazaflavin-dependent oxidoreductase (nitroreductase family)
MGLASDLDYHHRSDNPLHRAVRWWAGTRPGAWLFSRSLRHLDDLVGRLSRGRHSAPGLLAGLAVLDLTTTGRKSGRPRTSHLIATPYAGTLALIGTNFGQPGTPGWVVNLEADPRAVVTYRGTSRPVVARPADPHEVKQVFAASAGVYSGYQKYRGRIDGRRVRVFVLAEPDPDPASRPDQPA